MPRQMRAQRINDDLWRGTIPGHAEVGLVLLATGRLRRRRSGWRVTCGRCDELIKPGETAVRAITNRLGRDVRICLPCMEEIQT